MNTYQRLIIAGVAVALAITGRAVTPDPVPNFMRVGDLAAEGAPAFGARLQNPAAAAASVTEDTDPIDAILDARARPITFEGTEIAAAFYQLGRSYGLNINVDPDVTGTALLRFNGGTLRELIDALLETNDLFWTRKRNMFYVKRTQVEFYYIEYPQVNRTTSSQTAISLSPSTQSGGSTNFANNGVNAVQLNNSVNALGNGAYGIQGTTGDSTQFQISEKNEDTHWSGVENDIKSQVQKDEKIVLNKFSGMLTVDTTLKRHAFWKSYIERLNKRINAQVLIEVRIDEVVLNNEHKLGIDWTQISTAIENAATVGPIQTTTDITTIGSQTLAGDTLLGNFSVGKLSAAFAALRQQGEIKTLLKPSIRLLNNQKGFVKAGDDKTFWSLYSNITINNNSITPQTTTQKIYQGQRQTFGVVLPVTAQISDDGWVTLVIEPARTDLKGTDVSPDGEQTSPTTADQRISTMLRLRDNESAIIGGLSNETSGEQTRGVPGLSAIKFLGLGKLFRTDAKFTTISELVVTVSVKIIQ
ncbi:hypothetical protein OH491_28085 (plasmid) [Termitidicoccus mucosus]|uniref:Type II/III secretion system secretin-like domain-containing protein n=1 Tax=Termitidicoccus mucosus TaxID=1184151 RepID=A0A178IR14_9BACT|nr:hypothetical protein AW736_26205 [Opitutaceae bacterium TSB47]